MRRYLPLITTLLLAACASPSVPPVASSTKPATSPVKETPSNPPCKCSEPEKKAPITAQYQPAVWTELPTWPAEGLLAGWPAWLQSCKSLNKKPEWQASCQAAEALAPRSDGQVQQYFEQQFQLYRIVASDGAERGLITGYYEPLIQGSRKASDKARYPVYGVPDDLLTIDLGELLPELKGQRVRGRLEGRKVVPYFTREDLEAGKGKLTGKELAWVDDAIELFFLQIQGSGRIRLDDGSLLRIGYADQNGHPYKSIGRWLIDKGELTLENASMQGIQTWARAHPHRLAELLNVNPSYVFFKPLAKAEGGPIGAMGQPLTDGFSIAIDPRYTPLGSPVFLSTNWPNSSRTLNRLMYAQDTGGAIRGPVRADVFWGYGAEAGSLAGKMRQQGAMWLLWPKTAAAPGSRSDDNKTAATKASASGS